DGLEPGAEREQPLGAPGELRGESVRDEERVEEAALGGLRHALEVLEVEESVGLRRRVAPGGHVVARTGDERAEPQLAGMISHWFLAAGAVPRGRASCIRDQNRLISRSGPGDGL